MPHQGVLCSCPGWEVSMRNMHHQGSVNFSSWGCDCVLTDQAKESLKGRHRNKAVTRRHIKVDHDGAFPSSKRKAFGFCIEN